MTDQELIEKLRLGFANPIAAANRIEDLLKFSSYWHNRAEALEAKLAKAVEALQKIGKTYSADGFRLIHSDRQIINMVYIVLAELEKRND